MRFSRYSGFFPSLDSLTSYVSRELALAESFLTCRISGAAAKEDATGVHIEKIFHVQRIGPGGGGGTIAALVKLTNDGRMFLSHSGGTTAQGDETVVLECLPLPPAKIMDSGQTEEGHITAAHFW